MTSEFIMQTNNAPECRPTRAMKSERQIQQHQQFFRADASAAVPAESAA